MIMHTCSETALAEGSEPVTTESGLRMAWRDIRRGFLMTPYAARLAWADIRLRYRGSFFGPFWLTLSSAVMIGAMGIVYSRLFQIELSHYLPFTAISFALWFSWIAPVIAEASTCFIDARAQIFAAKLPLTVQILRLLIRNTIVLLHVIVVPIAVFIWFRHPIGLRALLSFVGIGIWIVDGFALSLLLGSICARFRDIPQIVGAVMQIAFYVTPIIWQPSQLAEGSKWLVLNPLCSFITVVRGPLLGEFPSVTDYSVTGGLSVILLVVAVSLFSSTRNKIAYWL